MDIELRPRLRGVLHQTRSSSRLSSAQRSCSRPWGRERAATAIFAATLATMFGVSALYHRVVWAPHARRWMRRLDHAAIYLLIAGTYTPFALLALEGAWRWTILPVYGVVR